VGSNNFVNSGVRKNSVEVSKFTSSNNNKAMPPWATFSGSSDKFIPSSSSYGAYFASENKNN
jgi:hypothetical protein